MEGAGLTVRAAPWEPREAKMSDQGRPGGSNIADVKD